MAQSGIERLRYPSGSNIKLRMRLERVTDDLGVANLDDFSRQNLEIHLLAIEFLVEQAEGLP